MAGFERYKNLVGKRTQKIISIILIFAFWKYFYCYPTSFKGSEITGFKCVITFYW